jgi:hypothetical protein
MEAKGNEIRVKNINKNLDEIHLDENSRWNVDENFILYFFKYKK